MKRPITIAAMLFGVVFALPAAAQLQYFGYVLGGDAAMLGKTKNYTNFVHVVATMPEDAEFLARVQAINQRGLKVTIDLGQIFWCGPEYNYLCNGAGPEFWQERWNRWKTYNASILQPTKVLAVAVRDEALLFDVDLNRMQEAAAYVKSDANLAPWLKIFYIEGACKVATDQCGPYAGNNGFNRAPASLPSIDWIGVDIYGIHPASDWEFQTARSRMKTKYPGKKWIYVADGYWREDLHAQSFWPNDIHYMATIAREWYDVARADVDAILMGFFLWPSTPETNEIGSADFPCDVLAEHVSIGRAITGKTRGSTPIGTYSIDSLGVVSGWTCDPDQTVCEQNPRVDVRVDGVLVSSVLPPYNDTTFSNLQCGTETAFRFKITLPRNTAGKTITVTSDDTDTNGATVPSSCPGTPSCSWTSHLKYYGYSGSADDTTNRGLNETKGFTNFSHIAVTADPANTALRDRVAAMNARGVKGTIDLGLLLWCGTNYRTLCSDWQTRWSTWKTTNASILTADKVLALVPRAEPFNYNVNMTQYDQVTAFIKADATVGSWVKLWLIEAGCVVANGNCGAYPGSNAYFNYTGTLPSVDWIGLNTYVIHPATDSTFQLALNRIKTRFPSKPRIYVMDGFWDAGHTAVFGSNMNSARALAREWYDVAHNDPGAILLGIYSWTPFGSGTTGSRDFSCTVLAEHREIGREITLKRRNATALPFGRLEDIYDGPGTVFGYACDPDGSLCENPVIDFYSDGVLLQSLSNYPSRNDSVPASQCSTGLAQRFRGTINPWGSGHNITAKARDLDSGSTTLPSNCAENPACLWYSTSYEPKGYMEAISPSGVAAGWVCDPDAPHISTKVRLALDDGTPIGTYTTNLASEQAVADECRGGYLHRFSVQLPAWARYRTIYALAQDVAYSYYEVQLPWLCDPGDYQCTWY